MKKNEIYIRESHVTGTIHAHTFHPDQPAKTSFHYHSARVHVTHERPYVCRLDYSGVMGLEAFRQLHHQAVLASQDACVLQIHTEKALITTNIMPAPGRDVYRTNIAPGAVIVRKDQFELWQDYADAMERIGVTRLIFLESQQQLVERFVNCLTGAQSLIEQQRHGETAAP